MMHLLAYYKSSAGTLTNEDTPGMADSFATLDPASHYILQQNWYILWAYILGAQVKMGRLNTPFLRSVSLPSIQPVDQSATVTTLPPIDWQGPAYPMIRAIDATELDITTAAGASVNFGLLGLTDAPVANIAQSQVFTVHATAAITVGNTVWGSGTFTLDQSLPAGTYDVVGMDVVGANLVAARLIFQGGGPRPGCVARTTFALKPDLRFRNGRLGTWGSFNSTAQPYLELLGTGAPTTQDVFLDLIKRS